CLCLSPRRPRPLPFPYTTLFRSGPRQEEHFRLDLFRIELRQLPELGGVRLEDVRDDEPIQLRQRPPHLVDVRGADGGVLADAHQDRKSTRLNSSHVKISYAVSCL